MLLLDRQKAPAPRHGGEPIRPQLRVKADGRLLNLPHGKTTIGSSPRCDIRIQQPGVQPLHCLIVHEGQTLSVRRWADNARLNGQTFVEAPLGIGDCLTLGSVELEVVGSQEPMPLSTEPARAAEVTATTGLRRGRDLARERSRRLIAALRHSRSIKNELSQRVANLCEELATGVANRERVSRELQEASAALDDSRKRLVEYESLLAAQQEVSAKNDQLSREVNELHQFIAALNLDQAAAEVEQRSLREEISRLESQIAEADERYAATCADRDEIRHRHEVLDCEGRELQQRVSALYESQAKAEADQQALRAEIARLEDQAILAKERHSAVCGEREVVRQQNEELQGTLSDLGLRLDALNAELASVEADRRARGAENALLQEELAQAQERHAGVCGERDDVRRQNEGLSAAASQLQQRIDALNDTMSDEQASAENERQKLRGEIARIQEQAAQADQRHADVCGERDGIRRHNEELIRQASELQQRIDVLTEKCDRLSSEIAESRAQADQRHTDVCGERDGTRRHNEELVRQVGELQERIEILAGEQMQLEAARQALQNENTGLADERRRLGDEIAESRSQVVQSAESQSAICAQRDELRRQNEQLQTGIAAVCAERDGLAAERDHLSGQCDDVRRQKEQFAVDLLELQHEADALAVAKLAAIEECDALRKEAGELRAGIETTSQENAMLSATKSQLAEECERLRSGAMQVAELERKIQEATTERENTSAELYRALLQLADMRASDEHHEALSAAHEALNVALEKSAEEVAQLQVQLDRLVEERSAAEAARQSLAEQTAAHEELRRRLAEENSDLAVRLIELQGQIRDQTRDKWESNARLLEAESLGTQLQESRQHEVELTETVAKLQSEASEQRQAIEAAASRAAEYERQLAEQAQRLEDAAEKEHALAVAVARTAECERQLADQARRLVEADETQKTMDAGTAKFAEFEQQIAEQDRQLAEADKSNQRLDEQVARLAQERTDLDRARQEWMCERAAAERQRAESESQRAKLTQRIAELETQFAAAKELAAAPRNSVEPQPAPTEIDWSSVRTASAASCVPTPERSLKDGSADSVAGTDPPVWGSAAAGPALQQEPNIPPLASGQNENWQTAPSSNTFAADAEQPSEKQVVRSNDGDVRTAPAAPESYIERYSHLFKNDDAVNAEPAPLRQSPELPSNRASTSGNAPAGQSQRSSDSEDEESIEQYMAKLLQRVRGEAPATPIQPAAPVQSSTPTSYGNSPAFGATTAAVNEPPTESSDASTDLASSVQPDEETAAPQVEEINPRRSSSPAPATDFRSLRALANETARRAISTHALGKNRRNMVTQIIVSMLAGVTSLWLMLESSDWFTVQFITACLSLVVAAYWAGQTYRTLLESFRVATFDRPEMTSDDEQPVEDAPLPIDVDE